MTHVPITRSPDWQAERLDLDAYLTRIGYDGPRDPTIASTSTMRPDCVGISTAPPAQHLRTPTPHRTRIILTTTWRSPPMFSDAQLAYLSSQILGRLATLGPDGPQVRPVGFSVDADAGVIEIGGYDLPSTRKWKNIRADARVAFVVDDLASTDPWRPRAVEVRGTAETLAVADGADRDLIRITPDRVLAIGLER